MAPDSGHHPIADPPLARSAPDRAAEWRMEPGLIDRLVREPSTRVLAVHADRVPVTSDGRLHLVPASVVADADHLALLGRTSTAAPILAAVFGDVGAPPDLAGTGRWAALREAGGELPADDAALFVEALSLARWLRDAPHCPACGARTEVVHAGWARRCPACGREHFPRTDPAVIVAVTSADDPDRLLLGSNAAWPAGRYSCFAGFVEAGESLESAVEREIAEEAGVDVVQIAYRGSQAWPYPRSLMLGFRAVAAADDAARPDGEEIVDVRWLHRDEIGAAFAGDGEITLPGTASIAYRLIRDWYEERV